MDARAVAVWALVATALAGPIANLDSDNNQCATTCIDSAKFGYVPGTTYTYDYRVETTTSMAGASEDTARLTLTATGDLHVLSPCEFSLQLRNTRLSHSDVNGNMKTADREAQLRSKLEASPLRLSYEDGRVAHVCPSTGADDAWTMNVKKGFLSAFQNSMDNVNHSQNLTETDVTGTCKTEYVVVNVGYYVTTVRKVKDILSCTDRHNFETIVQATPYFLPSDVQSPPLMRTSHQCEQSLEVGGLLKASECAETHVYRPFANGGSGGSTKVSQRLTYKTQTKGMGAKTGAVGPRDTLNFDHSVVRPMGKEARLAVEQKLNAICESTFNEVRPDSPRLFSELVAAMKSVDAADMEEVYHLLKTKSLCPSNGRTFKFFLDALPMINTRNSVHLMAKLIANKDVKGLEAQAWLTALAFVPQPTSEMIMDVKVLIDNKKVRGDALLPVSSLVNNFCRRRASCDSDKAVLSIVRSFERIIGKRCDATGKDFDEILLTLRAIGNAGHASRAVGVLNTCLEVTSNPSEIRIAAMEAFRRMPCTAEDQSLWDLFTNRSLDSELRSVAYLALMRCPTEMNLGRISSVLSVDDNDQVGAFVYSHLTNLKESSNPHKQDVARMIDNLALEKEFDLNPLKFSRNYEMSMLINTLNTGITAESNLVWSSTDQLPRSVTGNLTVELFGQSVNVFDFGGRLEGLEYLLRNVLGPYVNSNGKNDAQIDFKKIHGSIFGRVFGNEMVFVHSQTAKSPFGNMPSKWLDVLIKLAKRQEFAFTQNIQFIDACLVIPTAAGLPLQMHVNGTATVDLVVSGKMDLRKVGASPRSMDVDGEVKPSAALEMTGTMAVDAFVTTTGLRMRNTLHSSTSVKGRIQLERGRQLQIEFDTPQDRMEIFGAKSQFFILHDNFEQEQEMIKENRQEFEACSGKSLTAITGMELCGQLTFPNASHKPEGPYFPLTGPTAASVTLFKRDTHSGYKLFAKRIWNKKAHVAQFIVNTPGSKVDRAITVDTTLNFAKQMVELNLFSPWKRADVKGNVINHDGEKSVSGSVVIDDDSAYAFTSELKATKEKGVVRYSPRIELKRPGSDDVLFIGSMAVERQMKSLDVELSLAGLRKFPYTLKSSIVNTDKDKILTASLSTDDKNVYSIEASNRLTVTGKKSITASLKSKFVIKTPTRQLMSISGTGNFRQDKSLKLYTSVAIHRLLKRPASLKVNLVKTAKKRGSRYDLDVLLKSSPISARIDSNMFMKEKKFISTKTTLDYFIPNVDKNKIVVTGKFSDKSTKSYKKFSLRSNLNVKTNPDYNMGMVLDLEHKKRLSEVELDFKYGPNPKDKTKRIYFLTSLTKKIANSRNALVSYKIKALAPAHKIDVFMEGKHEHTPKTLNSSIQLKYHKKQEANFALVLRDQSAKLTKLSAQLSAQWPGTEYIVRSQLVQNSPKQYSHVLSLQCNNGVTHSLSTIYANPTANTYEIGTEASLHGFEPVILNGSTTLNLRNFAASGKVISKKNVYGFVVTSRIMKGPNAKVRVELIHPTRRMTLDVNAVQIRSKYEGSIAASWDADDANSKVILNGVLQQEFKGRNASIGGKVNFISPFTHFEDLSASIKYMSDPSKHNMDGKFSWGGKRKLISTNLNVKKMLSFKNLDISVGFKSSFRGFRNAELRVAHNLTDSVTCVLEGNWEKEKAKFVFQGQDLSTSRKTEIKGSLALKSSLKNLKAMTATFSHSFSGGKLHSNMAANHNGQKYHVAISVAHAGSRWQFKNNGDFMVKSPKQILTTQWAYRNTDQAMTFSLTSNCNKKTFKIDFSGYHELSDSKKINAELRIQSPWKVAHTVELNFDHTHGNGLLKSKALLNRNGKINLFSRVTFQKNETKADVEFEFNTPLNKDIAGKMNVQYDKYPVTSYAEFSWAPNTKASLEGSLNVPSWPNGEIDVKLTTPSRKYRNILFKAANTKSDTELITQLFLDYGVRQSIDCESRLGYGSKQKSFRVKLASPFDSIKSLDTGITFEGTLYKFDGRADVELIPALGKVEALVNWQCESDINGKIRLNTPFQNYPYFELSTSSVLKSNLIRQSRVQLEYYPSKTLSLESAYRFDLPLSFESTIRSSDAMYDNIGVSFKHNFVASSVQTHSEIRYKPDTMIEADLNADWSTDIGGSLVVKTPFKDFDINHVSLKHKGNKQSYSSNAEVSIAQKKVSVDVSLKTGYVTSASVSFTSPIPGMEDVNASLKKRGTLANIKGGVVITVNKDKAQITFNNKVSSSSIKSGLVISSPYTETFKLFLNHKGLLNNFGNKMSLRYGHKVDVDAGTSFSLRQSDVTAKASLKCKLGKNRRNAKLDIAKSGPIENMSFSGKASFDRKIFGVSGFWKNENGIDGSVTINTPYKNFKTTGITLNHKGDLNKMESMIDVTYMDRKTIHGSMELFNPGGSKTRLAVSLSTPFKDFELNTIQLSNEMMEVSKQMHGEIALTSTVRKLGTVMLFYRKSGDLSNFLIDSTLSRNGKDMASLNMANKISENKLSSGFEMKSIATPVINFSIDHVHDDVSLNTTTLATFGETTIFSEAHLNRGFKTIDASSLVVYKSGNRIEHKGSINVHTYGSLDLCNLRLNGKLNDDEVELSLSKQGQIQNLKFNGMVSYNTQAINVNGSWKMIDGFNGKIDLQTPFQQFYNTGVKLSHVGDSSAFVSNAVFNYMDGKEISGSIDLTAKSVEKIQFSTHLSTPFKGYKSIDVQFNNNYNKHNTDVSGKLVLVTPIANIGTKSIKYSKIGFLNDLKVTFISKGNGIEDLNLKILNDFDGQDLHSMFGFKATQMQEIMLSVDHTGDFNNLETIATCKFGENDIISGEATLNINDTTIDGEGKFMYNIATLGENEGLMIIHKEGGRDDLAIEVTLETGNILSNMTFDFKNSEEQMVSLILNTPVKDFNHVGLSFTQSRKLNNYNLEGKLELMDEFIFTGKMNLHNNLLQHLETDVEVTTPFKGIEFIKYEYSHKTGQGHFKCSSILHYSDSKNIVSDLNMYMSPYPSFALSVKTPDRSISSSGSVEYAWPKYAVKGNIHGQNGRVLALDGSLDLTTEATTGFLKINTQAEHFTDIGFAFSLQPKNNGFDSSGRVTFMDDETVSAKAHVDFSSKGRNQMSLEMRTPFAGYEFTKFETDNSMSKNSLKSTAKVTFGNDKIIVHEIYSILNPQQELSISLQTPFENYEDLFVFLSFDNSWPKYTFTSKLNAGNENNYSLTGLFDMSGDIVGTFTIATPHENFTDVGIYFHHSGNAEKFDTDIKISYMDGKDISGKLNFYRYMWRRVSVTSELSTPFGEMGNAKAEVNFEDNSNSLSTTAIVEYGAGEKFNGNVKWTYTPNYDLMVTLSTPFNDYNLIRAHGSLDVSSPSYECTCRLDGGHNQVYSASGKLNLHSVQNVDATLEINTPLAGWEYTKSEYRHKLDDIDIDGYIALVYMDEKKISAEVKTMLTPHFDTTVTVKTPFTGFENMQGIATFEESYNRYEAFSSLSLGNKPIYSVSSDIDFASFPMKASARISSPLADFRNMKLTLSHDGEINNFASTAFFTSPLTDDINAKANFKFDSILNVAASASIQSQIEGFDDLRTEVKLSNDGDERKLHVLMGWTKGHSVTIDSLCSTQQDWYGRTLYADLSVLTPFPALQSLAGKLETSEKDGSLKHEVGLDVNGNNVLDLDSNLKFKDRPEVEVSIRRPWPMFYTASTSRNGDTASAHVFLNWNRDDQDSNIGVQASVSDSSNDYQTENAFDLSVIHASRKIGLAHKVSTDASLTSASGQVYWDGYDGKVTYDLQLTDNSRRRKQIIDGSFKLGLPSRTLGLTGSYSDTKVAKAADMAFSWDMDHDVSKRVGIKATVNRGEGLKGDIALSLPSLRKEIRVDGEVMLKNGRIVFDTRTDLSYSEDSRKTLTLTSKLTDVTDHYNNFNYSLSLGVSHPHTNLDLKINSHLGSSDEMDSFGFNTEYLTAKRQIKNMALLTEINKLKRKINLQVASPDKTVEVAGHVVSTHPYKLRMLNKINDVETFRSDVTIDPKKKSVLFNAFVDTEGVTVSATYPNKTAFQADVTHHSLDEEHVEGLLSVRLNTSRLLHTTLSWRPQALEELRAVAMETTVQSAMSAKATLSEINEAIGDELSAKHIAITEEITSELQPFISSLNEELSMVADGMEELNNKLKAMYERNDFYVQAMGDDISEYAAMLQGKLTKLTQAYRNGYQELIRAMTRSIRDLNHYPIREEYTRVVEGSAGWINDQVVQSLTWVESVVDGLDHSLQQYRNKASQIQQHALDTIYNATYADYLSNQLDHLHGSIDVKPYITSLKLPQDYTDAIYSVHSNLYSRVADFLDKPHSKFLKDRANEVYQQGIWAYHYWQMEENIRKHTQSIVETLKEIIQDQLKELSKDLQLFVKNPITVWDPANGTVQADLPLPMAVKRLDRAPDLSPLVKRAEKIAALYLPDHTTWNKIVRTMSEAWSAGSANHDKEVSLEAQNKGPIRKRRRRRRKLYDVYRYAGQ